MSRCALFTATFFFTAAASADCREDAAQILAALDYSATDTRGLQLIAMHFASAGPSFIDKRATAAAKWLADQKPVASERAKSLCAELGYAKVAQLKRDLDAPELQPFFTACKTVLGRSPTRQNVSSSQKKRSAEAESVVLGLSLTGGSSLKLEAPMRKFLEAIYPRSAINLPVPSGAFATGASVGVFRLVVDATPPDVILRMSALLQTQRWKRLLSAIHPARVSALEKRVAELQAFMTTAEPSGSAALANCMDTLVVTDSKGRQIWRDYGVNCAELFVYAGMYSTVDSVLRAEAEDRWTMLAAGLQRPLCRQGSKEAFCVKEPPLSCEPSKRAARPLIDKHLATVHGPKLGAELSKAFWLRNDALFPCAPRR